MARSNPWKHKPRNTRHTTLVVVEGDTEEAFLKHIQSTCGRNCGTRLTIENTHGGSGDYVLAKAISVCSPFDICACIYDADREATIKKNLAKAKRLSLQLIVPSPSIEALLLEILGARVPNTTEQCKTSIKRRIPDDRLTTVKSFQKHFSIQLLLAKRSEIPMLDALFRLVDRRK